ncbi:MAG: c-type cytochrome [Rhodobacteraceae bacterium]|nr:c-type cytochrome [Paracoccaceae bacterium]
MRLLPLAFAALLAMPALASPPDPGKVAFQQMCAACHGTDGRGDGPKAALLSAKPADLTTLSARSGGIFPMLHVIDVLDGSEQIGAHSGLSPMPDFSTLVGGQSAALDTPGGTVLFTRGVFLSIAYYLESLQK